MRSLVLSRFSFQLLCIFTFAKPERLPFSKSRLTAFPAFVLLSAFIGGAVFPKNLQAQEPSPHYGAATNGQVTPDGFVRIPAPDASVDPSAGMSSNGDNRGFFRDAVQIEGDLLSVEAPEVRMASAPRFRPDLSRAQGPASGPGIGNIRDPLSSKFTGQTSPPRGHIDPYEEMRFDARLNDLFFLDSGHGWAVGDHGAIWHYTVDQDWVLQETPIDIPLYGVHFVDSLHGLAVGGYTTPSAHQGIGVVLRTVDGGKTWEQVPLRHLPILTQVRMIDTQQGWAVGCGSESCASGLFLTQDGGRSWQAVSGKKTAGWADFGLFDPVKAEGVGLDFDGMVQIFGEMPRPATMPQLGARRPRALIFERNKEGKSTPNGWLVGDGGLVLRTTDGGKNWTAAPGALPGKTAEHFDLKTLCTVGQQIWVAGTPGTKIFHSADGGKTWTATSTGVPLPIRKLVFLDPQRGWAVGELGMILSTDNGGRSWLVRRSGGRRLAVLAVHNDPENLPFEVLAKLCGDEGYLGGVALATAPESVNTLEGGEIPRDRRLHEALLRCGVSASETAWAFPGDDPDLKMPESEILKRFDRIHDKKGAEKFRASLVRLLRTWRPEILLTVDDRMATETPATSTVAAAATEKTLKKAAALDELLRKELLAAVDDAADATRFPEHLSEAGLEPWTVRKVHTRLPENVIGEFSFRPWNLSPRLCQPLNEIADTARGLLHEHGEPSPQELSFSTPHDLGSPANRRDFFSGLNIPPGCEIRRGLIGVFLNQQEEAFRNMNQRRNVLGILEKMARDERTSQAPQAQLPGVNGKRPPNLRLASAAGEMARKLDTDECVKLLLDLGRRYDRYGDWESAAAIYMQIVAEHARHPLAGEAYLWLIRHFSSEEAAIRCFYYEGIGNTSAVWAPPAPHEMPRYVQEAEEWGITIEERLKMLEAEFEWQRQREILRQRRPAHIMARIRQALVFGKILESNLPEQSADPRIRFALAAAERAGGWYGDSVGYFRSRGRSPNDDVWSMRARTEAWLLHDDRTNLAKEQRDCPIPAFLCTRTPRKPLLDGLFTDATDGELWFHSKMYTLTTAKPRPRLAELIREDDKKPLPRTVGTMREDASRAKSMNLGTQVMFLYDDDHLFLALRCKKTPGFSYDPQLQLPRNRDSNLSEADRVEILLDVDRDYGHYYNLTVDYRGWVTDSCLGDVTWNPNWHLARNEDEEYWYIEAAIELDSLTARQIGPLSAWGIALRRIVPGHGIECWNAENSFDLTEGFGLLLFE